jgi:hypothetical protein
MCRFLVLALLVQSLAVMAEGQTLQDQVNRLGHTPGSSLNELQPTDVPRKLLAHVFENCPVTDRAGVQKDLEQAAGRAETVETILGLTVVFLTGDEGGKAEQEFVPALLSRARTGAKVVYYWDKAQAWFYGRKGPSKFQVCRPGPGIVVVRPVQDAFPEAAGLAGAPSQPFPRLPLGSPLVGLDASRMTLRIPPCTPYPLFPADVTSPWVLGRVVMKQDSSAGWVFSLNAVVVTLFGSSPGSCVTGGDGKFFFHNLRNGDYTLMIGASYSQALKIEPGINITIGDVIQR